MWVTWSWTTWRYGKKNFHLLHLIVFDIIRILLAFSYFSTCSELWSPPNFPLVSEAWTAFAVSRSFGRHRWRQEILPIVRWQKRNLSCLDIIADIDLSCLDITASNSQFILDGFQFQLTSWSIGCQCCLQCNTVQYWLPVWFTV